jgi:hypothetical protein
MSKNPTKPDVGRSIANGEPLNKYTEPDPVLRDPGLEAAVWVPNLLLLLVVVLYFLIVEGGRDDVQPLIMTDKKTASKIEDLERAMAREPGNQRLVLELARLYSRAGEVPFSYDALRNAEVNGSQEPFFRAKLGMAYLEIGKNLDGQRILKRTLQACQLRSGRSASAGERIFLNRCSPGVVAKLDIFKQVADIFVKRSINARFYPDKARAVFDEVLKRIELRDSFLKKALAGSKAKDANKKAKLPRNAPKTAAKAPAKAPAKGTP